MEQGEQGLQLLMALGDATADVLIVAGTPGNWPSSDPATGPRVADHIIVATAGQVLDGTAFTELVGSAHRRRLAFLDGVSETDREALLGALSARGFEVIDRVWLY